MSFADARPSRGGFTLLEVMLALGLFSFAVLALAGALNKTLDAALLRRRETLVRTGLENTLAELRLQPLQPGRQSTQKPDAQGVIYDTEVKLTDNLETEEKDKLTGIYLVTLTARWKEVGEPQERKVQLYVYQP
jgi:type II secretion system protein I